MLDSAARTWGAWWCGRTGRPIFNGIAAPAPTVSRPHPFTAAQARARSFCTPLQTRWHSYPEMLPESLRLTGERLQVASAGLRDATGLLASRVPRKRGNAPASDPSSKCELGDTGPSGGAWTAGSDSCHHLLRGVPLLRFFHPTSAPCSPGPMPCGRTAPSCPDCWARGRRGKVKGMSSAPPRSTSARHSPGIARFQAVVTRDHTGPSRRLSSLPPAVDVAWFRTAARRVKVRYGGHTGAVLEKQRIDAAGLENDRFALDDRGREHRPCRAGSDTALWKRVPRARRRRTPVLPGLSATALSRAPTGWEPGPWLLELLDARGSTASRSSPRRRTRGADPHRPWPERSASWC